MLKRCKRSVETLAKTLRFPKRPTLHLWIGMSLKHPLNELIQVLVVVIEAKVEEDSAVTLEVEVVVLLIFIYLQNLTVDEEDEAEDVAAVVEDSVATRLLIHQKHLPLLKKSYQLNLIVELIQLHHGDVTPTVMSSLTLKFDFRIDRS
jgi:hypothetical protein